MKRGVQRGARCAPACHASRAAPRAPAPSHPSGKRARSPEIEIEIEIERAIREANGKRARVERVIGEVIREAIREVIREDIGEVIREATGKRARALLTCCSTAGSQHWSTKKRCVSIERSNPWDPSRVSRSTKQST